MRVEELTTTELESIRKCFVSFDRERMGYLPTKDFGSALRWLKLIPTESQVKQLLFAIDPKKTGHIRFQLFATAVAQLWERDQVGFERELWRCFMHFDKGDTGKISADELRRILTEYGMEPIPEREANKIIGSFVDSRSNMIEYGLVIRKWQS